MRLGSFCLLVVVLVVLVPTAALAGDPCPISFNVFNVGPPPWLATTAPKTDPFFDALIRFANGRDCSEVRRGKVVDGHLSLKPHDTTKEKLALKYLLKRLFAKNRRFSCAIAAKKLRGIRYAGDADGNVLYIRGRRRVMLTLPGWDSLCVRAKDVDGPKLTKKNVLRVWKRLTRRLVAHRHANP
jgi:hypothetical protein